MCQKALWRARGWVMGSRMKHNKVSPWKVIAGLGASGAFIATTIYLASTGYWLYSADAATLDSTIAQAKAIGYPLTAAAVFGNPDQIKQFAPQEKLLHEQMAAIKSALAKPPKEIKSSNASFFPRIKRVTEVPDTARWLIAQAGPQIDAATKTVLGIGKDFLAHFDANTAMFGPLPDVDAIKLLCQYSCDRAIVAAIDNNIGAAITHLKTSVALVNCLSSHPLTIEDLLYHMSAMDTCKAISQCMEIHPDKVKDFYEIFTALETFDARPSLRTEAFYVVPFCRFHRELGLGDDESKTSKFTPDLGDGLPTDYKGRALLGRAIKNRMELIKACDLSKPRDDRALIQVLQKIDQQNLSRQPRDLDPINDIVEVPTFNLSQRIEMQYERAHCMEVFTKAIEFWNIKKRLPTQLSELHLSDIVPQTGTRIGFKVSENEMRVYNFDLDRKDNHGKIRSESNAPDASLGSWDEAFIFRPLITP